MPAMLGFALLLLLAAVPWADSVYAMPQSSAGWVSPDAGATVSGEITLIAKDDGTATYAEFFYGNWEWIGRIQGSGQYETSFNTSAMPEGAGVFWVAFYNSAGSMLSYHRQDVSVSRSGSGPSEPTPAPEAPSIGWVSPASGATVSGTVTLASLGEANASYAEFFYGDWEWIGRTWGSGYFEHAFDTRALSQGPAHFWVVFHASGGSVLSYHKLNVSVSNAGEESTPTPPAPGSADRFSTLQPGATLPSGAQCAGRVRRSQWEPRPENAGANQTTGIRVARIDGADPEGNTRFAWRIDGNFTGTTDEIIQWAACKWGFDEDVVRAVAVQETWWDQSFVGDNGQSFGLMQVKATVHEGTHPASQRSTAFNLDYALAWKRTCFEGYFSHWISANTRGDEWGCTGLWFSGSWNSGDQDYIAAVKLHLAQRTWQTPEFNRSN